MAKREAGWAAAGNREKAAGAFLRWLDRYEHPPLTISELVLARDYAALKQNYHQVDAINEALRAAVCEAITR